MAAPSAGERRSTRRRRVPHPPGESPERQSPDGAAAPRPDASRAGPRGVHRPARPLSGVVRPPAATHPHLPRHQPADPALVLPASGQAARHGRLRQGPLLHVRLSSLRGLHARRVRQHAAR